MAHSASAAAQRCSADVAKERSLENLRTDAYVVQAAVVIAYVRWPHATGLSPTRRTRAETADHVRRDHQGAVRENPGYSPKRLAGPLDADQVAD